MKKLVIILIALVGFLLPGSAQKSSFNELTGKWVFVSSSLKNFGQMPSNQAAELVFDDNTKSFSGSTGCNRVNGSYSIEGDQLTFGTIVSTNKACPNMDLENFLSGFLSGAKEYKIENEKLYLYDRADKSKYLVYKRDNLV